MTFGKWVDLLTEDVTDMEKMLDVASGGTGKGAGEGGKSDTESGGEGSEEGVPSLNLSSNGTSAKENAVQPVMPTTPVSPQGTT
mmetsp:Transcript_72196/g.205194  ORF Transcript_72196/g.205194 Transcript_72196/m.205194 type:complete len:84 (-) Transcript_72196:1184-1435(-)